MSNASRVIPFIPLLLSTALFLVCAFEHFYYVRNVAFQAVYLRLLAAFPLCALLSSIGGSFSKTFEWMQVLISCVESYVFLAFFGLLIGWAWTRGDVFQVVENSPRLRNHCYVCGKAYCGRFQTAEQMLHKIKWQVAQLQIVKPAVDLGIAIYYTISPPSESSKGLNPVKFGLSIVRIISVGVALFSLIVLYHALKSHEVYEEGKRQNLLHGLRAFRKFTIVKALLFFVLVNNLLFAQLIRDGKMPVPEFLCDSSENDLVRCEARYVAFIFSIESLALAILAALVFRPHDMDHIPEKFKNAYCDALPLKCRRPSAQVETTSDPVQGKCMLFLWAFCIWDVITVFPHPPFSRADGEEVELSSNLDEDDDNGDENIDVLRDSDSEMLVAE